MSLWTDEVMQQLVHDHEMDIEDADALIHQLQEWVTQQREDLS